MISFGKIKLIEPVRWNPSHGLPSETMGLAMKILDDPDIEQNCFFWIGMFDTNQ